MSVAERVTSRWPQTEAELLGNPDLRYAATKSRAITDALGDVFRGVVPAMSTLPSLADIDNGDGLIQQEIADRAVVALIPFAKDVVARGTLQHTLDAPNAISGSTRFYDKLALLDALATQIHQNMAERASTLADLLAQLTAAPPRSAAVPRLMLLASPRRRAP